jgi:glutamate synthase domain-containing protein 1
MEFAVATAIYAAVRACSSIAEFLRITEPTSEIASAFTRVSTNTAVAIRAASVKRIFRLFLTFVIQNTPLG